MIRRVLREVAAVIVGCLIIASVMLAGIGEKIW